jgi:hypothetical protein
MPVGVNTLIADLSKAIVLAVTLLCAEALQLYSPSVVNVLTIILTTSSGFSTLMHFASFTYMAKRSVQCIAGAGT